MNRVISRPSSKGGLKIKTLTAGFMLAIFVSLLGSVPGTVRAADCSTGTFSASGYFFTNYESVEYSPDGLIIHHFKVSPSYADGRSFHFSWSYYDDQCNNTGSLGFDKIISLPPGVTDWSVRFASASHADIWDDQANAIVTGIDFPERPNYTSATFSGNIDGAASTFNSRTLKINQNGQAPAFTGTLPLPPACAPSLVGSTSGSNQYFFDSYEHAEYKNGFLIVHLRLKTPYNDGRGFTGVAAVAGSDCLFGAPPFSFPNASIPAFARYYSFRMTSATHWQLWNDESEQPLSCTGCAGDFSSDTKFVSWSAFIDGGVSRINTTPFSPVEHTAPVYKECCSSVAFLPGIEGSILKSGTNTLWPPTLFDVDSDIGKLILNPDGTPVTPNVTVDGVISTFYTASVYRDFITFMNGLTAVDSSTGTSTIKAWEALPYDWRFSPEKILSDGVNTPTGTIDLVQEIEHLAQTSDTGKVTIVAHSMGGLMGKALIKKLMDKGEGDLIDSFVMVGSPQLGTPQTVGGLLHGEGSDIAGGIILSKANARALAHNMQSAYNLLPSQRYLSEVIDPVVVFDNTTTLTQSWRNFWGLSIGNFTEFFQFMSGNVLGVPVRSRPAFDDIQSPEVLREDLLTNAGAFHSEFDNFVFPPSIRVVQIAGWGLDTIKGVEYTQNHNAPDYEPRFTVEGDKNVVYPSALSSNSSESVYFNLSIFNKTNSANAEHRDFVGSSPIINLLSRVFHKLGLEDTNYISHQKPPLSETEKKLLVGVHSPVTIGAYDSQGRFTGIAPGQDPASGVQFVSEGIPGSQYVSFGDGKYILLPQGDTYTFAFNGTGSGPATVDVQQIVNDIQSDVKTYSDIPVTPVTAATLTIPSDVSQTVAIQVDQNADGKLDAYVASDGGFLSIGQLLVNLTTAVQNSSIKDKLKTQLLNKIISIQKKIDKQKQKQSNVLAKLQAQVQKQTDKGKIDAASAAQIGGLLDDLISQSATVPLDPVLINQLKDQINSLTVTQSLKNSLLAKVTQLQNLTGITKSLTAITQTVTNKGNKGQIPDADVQNILNLLDQIQNAI